MLPLNPRVKGHLGNGNKHAGLGTPKAKASKSEHTQN